MEQQERREVGFKTNNLELQGCLSVRGGGKRDDGDEPRFLAQASGWLGTFAGMLVEEQVWKML